MCFECGVARGEEGLRTARAGSWKVHGRFMEGSWASHSSSRLASVLHSDVDVCLTKLDALAGLPARSDGGGACDAEAEAEGDLPYMGGGDLPYMADGDEGARGACSRSSSASLVRAVTPRCASALRIVPAKSSYSSSYMMVRVGRSRYATRHSIEACWASRWSSILDRSEALRLDRSAESRDGAPPDHGLPPGPSADVEAPV